MRILIDLQAAQTDSRYRGIGRYALSLTRSIILNRGNHEVIIALNAGMKYVEDIRNYFSDILPSQNIYEWYGLLPVHGFEPTNKLRREVSELMREAFFQSLKPDVIHVLSIFDGFLDDAVNSVKKFDETTPVAVTFYDLIPLIYPKDYLKTSLEASHYHSKLSYLLKADKLLAISEYTRDEAITKLNLSSNQIVNVSTAGDSNFRRLSERELKENPLNLSFGINKPFILYTGGGDERKNLERLIIAFSKLAADIRLAHTLVITGKMGFLRKIYLNQAIKNAGLSINDVIFTSYISDDDLVSLYNQCKVFVFPSIHEGFGLPALEAMRCGAVTIGSNTTSIPEVINYPDALFNPLDINDITAKLARAIEDDNFRTDFRKHCFKQIEMFSWDTSAKKAIKAFEDIYRNQTVDSNQHKLILEKLIKSISEIQNIDKLKESDLLKLANILSENYKH